MRNTFLRMLTVGLAISVTINCVSGFGFRVSGSITRNTKHETRNAVDDIVFGAEALSPRLLSENLHSSPRMPFLSTLSSAILAHRHGTPVRGDLFYPGGQEDLDTVKHVLTLFPHIDRLVLVDPRYGYPSRRARLLTAFVENGFSAPSGKWPTTLLDNTFPLDSLEFDVSLNSRPLRVLLYARRYIEEWYHDYLNPHAIKEKVPNGFAVAISKRPGNNNRLSRPPNEFGLGKLFYKRLHADLRADGWLYVHDAWPPDFSVPNAFKLFFPPRVPPTELLKAANSQFLLYERIGQSA